MNVPINDQFMPNFVCPLYVAENSKPLFTMFPILEVIELFPQPTFVPDDAGIITSSNISFLLFLYISKLKLKAPLNNEASRPIFFDTFVSHTMLGLEYALCIAPRPN